MSAFLLRPRLPIAEGAAAIKPPSKVRAAEAVSAATEAGAVAVTTRLDPVAQRLA